MSDVEIQEILSNCTATVLETMCYADVIPSGEMEVPSEVLAAQLTFSGSLTGLFKLQASAGAAHSLTSSFLGFEIDGATHDDLVENVLCELANIVCGSVLSKLDSKASVDLQHPEMTQLGSNGKESISQLFLAEQEYLSVSLQLQK